TKELSGYLVGSVLTVQPADLAVTAGICAVVLTVFAVAGRALQFAAFDPTAATAAGYRVGLLNAVFLVAVELTVVTSVPAVRSLLSVALIVAPAPTARLWTCSTRTMTVLAAVIGVGSGLCGLLVSQYVRLPAGAAITLIATAMLVGSLAVTGLRRTVGRSPRPVIAER